MLRSLGTAAQFYAVSCRPLSSSSSVLALRNFFQRKEDLDLRPSDREIKEKDLPPNTPTLGQRIDRDFDAAFFQKDRKHGYHDPAVPTSVWDQIENLTPWELVKRTASNLRTETKKLVEEVKIDPWFHLPRPGDVRPVFLFNSEEDFAKWIVTTDSYWGEGYSEAQLVKSPTGKALFTGQLSCRIPQDGRTKRAGYVNMASKKEFSSFGRRKKHNWNHFSHIHLRVRGDGRKYMLNVHVHNLFDVMWHDLYVYPIYTRGGPYWQNIVIPFDRFFFTHQSALQDVQQPLHYKLQDVTNISFTLDDRIDGPFALEIDQIHLSLRPTFTPRASETHPYENYILPHRYYLNR